MIWVLSATAISIHAKSISFDSADDELANELCQDYFRLVSLIFQYVGDKFEILVTDSGY